MSENHQALLCTADGQVFRARSVGAAGVTTGEAVFNTSMTGYQEILTDPSYAGQVVVMTSSPWDRFPEEDNVLGPEMKATGEVMGIGSDVGVAFAKALLAGGNVLPDRGRVFLSFADRDKPMGLAVAQAFTMLGFDLVATSGTAKYLQHHAVAAEPVLKIGEGPRHIGERLENGEVQIVINTPRGGKARSDGRLIRQAARRHLVPCVTTIQGGLAVARSLKAGPGAIRRSRSIQEWLRTG